MIIWISEYQPPPCKNCDGGDECDVYADINIVHDCPWWHAAWRLL